MTPIPSEDTSRSVDGSVPDGNDRSMARQRERTVSFRIRAAEEGDIPVLRELIGDLAIYEKLEHEVIATEEDLRRTLFGELRYAEVVLAERWSGIEAPQVLGFALFFHNYSTFLGRPGIYLEDLFVRPAERGKGIGEALLRHLAQIACERGCGRLEWSVLDWNESAIQFYRRLGAVPMEEWTVFRVSGESLRVLARPEI